MGDRWLPYSAAALASGAVALVLGALGLPSSPDAAGLLENARLEEGRWIMAAAAFFFCSVGLGLGLPTFLYLLPGRGRRFGSVGVAVFGVATMALAAYGALLVLFQALAEGEVIGAADVVLLGESSGLRGFTFVLVGSFYLGEALLGIAVLRARTVPRWVPALMLLHVVTLPLTHAVPQLSTIGAVLAAVAFLGVAVFANERVNLLRVGRLT
jgi:hypothetical protein